MDFMKLVPLLIKYGGELAKCGKYLKYLPMLFMTISFVKEAERKFREADSNPEKLAWAREHFHALVNLLETGGILTAKLAKVLRDGADVIISGIVQFMNAEEGGVPIGGGEDDGTANLAPVYLEAYDPPVPDNDALKLPPWNYRVGDQVCQENPHAKWMVVEKGNHKGAAKLLRPVT